MGDNWTTFILQCLVLLISHATGIPGHEVTTASSNDDSNTPLSCATILRGSNDTKWTATLDACVYPELFSKTTGQCEYFTELQPGECGERVVPLSPCDYPVSNCSRPEPGLCVCNDNMVINYDSCLQRPDGNHAWPGHKWTPFYIRCHQRRTEPSECTKRSDTKIFNFIDNKCRPLIDVVNQAYSMHMFIFIPSSLRSFIRGYTPETTTVEMESTSIIGTEFESPSVDFTGLLDRSSLESSAVFESTTILIDSTTMSSADFMSSQLTTEPSVVSPSLSPVLGILEPSEFSSTPSYDLISSITLEETDTLSIGRDANQLIVSSFTEEITQTANLVSSFLMSTQTSSAQTNMSLKIMSSSRIQNIISDTYNMLSWDIITSSYILSTDVSETDSTSSSFQSTILLSNSSGEISSVSVSTVYVRIGSPESPDSTSFFIFSSSSLEFVSLFSLESSSSSIIVTPIVSFTDMDTTVSSSIEPSSSISGTNESISGTSFMISSDSYGIESSYYSFITSSEPHIEQMTTLLSSVLSSVSQERSEISSGPVSVFSSLPVSSSGMLSSSMIEPSSSESFSTSSVALVTPHTKPPHTTSKQKLKDNDKSSTTGSLSDRTITVIIIVAAVVLFIVICVLLQRLIKSRQTASMKDMIDRGLPTEFYISEKL